MTRRTRWVLFTAISAFLLAATVARAADSAEQQLIRAYSPIVSVRVQEDPPCDTGGEQYAPPTSVNAVLGNPLVKLVRYPPGKGSNPVVVKVAPTAADIAGLGPEYYLDLPGKTLDAGCTYARDYAALVKAGKAPAVTYAHIAREKGHSGFAVQYWFFYYFNQFNDVHEGDWEGMQITFTADTAAEALAQGPSEIALFQHGGGEKGAWDADKVEKDGTHPIVYPASGSHATFFSSNLFIGNGQQGSGLGCDNTQEPQRLIRVQPVAVPTYAKPGSQFQWLTYTGRWGQKEKNFNNGPQGPITKTQWLKPFEWMDGVRRASPTVPGGTILGPAISSAFCGLAVNLSGYFNYATKTIWGAIILAVVLAVLVLLPIVLTRWRPVDLDTLRRPRATGQLLRAARQLYGRNWKTLTLFGLLAVPIAWVGTLIDRLLGSDTFGFSVGGATFQFAVPFTSIAQLAAAAVVGAAAVSLVRNLDRGAPTGFIDSFRALRPCFWRAVLVQGLVVVIVVLLFITVVGIPFAIWKFVDWQFVQQEVIFENRSIRKALRGSARAVRGRWWHTAIVVALLFIIEQVTAPVLTVALVFTTLPPVWIDVIGSFIYALLIPYVVVARTFLYFDVLAREAELPANPRWRRALTRAKPPREQTA